MVSMLSLLGVVALPVTLVAGYQYWDALRLVFGNGVYVTMPAVAGVQLIGLTAFPTRSLNLAFVYAGSAWIIALLVVLIGNPTNATGNFAFLGVMVAVVLSAVGLFRFMRQQSTTSRSGAPNPR